MAKRRNDAITDVSGISVGHATNSDALTGCTAVLCEQGAVGGVDVRGGAPGTRETDLLGPMRLVERVHAVLLTGGSAFGLAAADGVMRYLSERGSGFDTGVARVPVVPAAVVFDLHVSGGQAYPDAEMGYHACTQASDGPLEEGNVGVGAGCSVGKILGPGRATKAGVGTISLDLGGGLVVGALVAVNALGDVIDPATGRILAGTRKLVGKGFADTLATMKGAIGKMALRFANTVVGVVATNAALSKEETNKVAQMAHAGLARAIRPAHTMLDGDTLFALSLGKKAADVSLVGAFAAEAVAEAVVRAVRTAGPAGGLPSGSEMASGM
jgi:L-aminopeptidase/D-esterase-like protein